MQQDKFKINNFDMLRLFAALQVAYCHFSEHLELRSITGFTFICKVLAMFPGVPIFFFISGFLISRSFEHNTPILNYSMNRALRIFPALMVCGLLSVLTITLSGYLKTVELDLTSYLIWLVSQISFFQFYDPGFLAGYGIGQTNGSLWTIFIELQFYILIPLLYLSANKLNTKPFFSVLVFILIIIFLIFHKIYYVHMDKSLPLYWLLGKTFAPYVYMFLIGVFIQRNFNFFYKYLANKFVFMLCLYIILYTFCDKYFSISKGNRLDPTLYFLLCCAIFSFAFSFRALSAKVLKSYDISYGVYLYHMPVANLFIYLGLTGKTVYFFVALCISLLMGTISFVYIERPMMKLKGNPLRPLT